MDVAIGVNHVKYLCHSYIASIHLFPYLFLLTFVTTNWYQKTKCRHDCPLFAGKRFECCRSHHATRIRYLSWITRTYRFYG